MNKLKLEYEMKMKGITAAEMCNALQISRSAFYRKCNGKTEFTRREIEEIIEILGIDKVEALEGIFLMKKCLKRYLRVGGGKEKKFLARYKEGE